jgi:hypothetical protein
VRSRAAFLRGVGRPPGEYALLVWNNENAAVAAAHSVSPDRWWDGFGEVMDRIGSRFARYEPRRHAAALMLGLLSGLDRKNCWTIAEHRGDVSPDGLQHLLSRAVWDADAVRDDLRGYVTDHLGDPGAVLVVDETGDMKKGDQSVGVQRQYTGTAGRIENAQVSVFVTYAAPRGHAFIDRALYLPSSWTADRDRCAAAGVPDDVEFATKPALATAMITAALDAGVPASWVAGDEVYGADPTLRATVRQAGLGYVLQVAANRRIPTGAGMRRVDELAAPLPAKRLEQGLGRARQQRRTDLLLGLDRHRRRRQRRQGQRRRGQRRSGHRPASPADPPQRHHRRACLPPLLHTAPGAADDVGAGGWATLAHRGIVPSRQGPYRTGPTPGQTLDIVAPLDHPRDARPLLPRRHHRPRTRPHADTGRADSAHRQRGPPAFRRHPARHHAHHREPAALVNMAPKTPSTRPRMPPPTTRTTMITIYGCRTRRQVERRPVRSAHGELIWRAVWL